MRVGNLEEMVKRMTDRDSASATEAANIQGGTHNNSVIEGVYPIVSMRVGKKALNDNDATRSVNVPASHQTLKSVSARTRPTFCCDPALLVPRRSVGEGSSEPREMSAPIPVSSLMRCMATSCSAGESQREVDVDSGKSGRIFMAQSATSMVRPPSMKKSHLRGIGLRERKIA